MEKKEVEKNILDLRHQRNLSLSNIFFAGAITLIVGIWGVGDPVHGFWVRVMLSGIMAYTFLVLGILKRNSAQSLHSKMRKLVE
ncbi:MAG: hypothetical protein SVV03_00655 [Candidatus Nanohaloarchaea archaeon]|nr:hypothetical protein [Candidatus Nanohaloarchaea archaeon]